MPAKGSSLDSWLEYISSVHPREIELGLDRTNELRNTCSWRSPILL